MTALVHAIASLIAQLIHEFARHCEGLEDLRVERARRAQ